MPVPERGVRDILIVGGTIAGWLTAAILARSLPASRIRIRLLESAAPVTELETLGGGVATLPALRTAHGLLGLPEVALLQQTGAGFSLGAEHAGWPKPGGRYFRPFGATGAGLDGVAFHNLWLRMRRAGGAGELEEYALGAMAARRGRFAFPSTDPASVLSTLDYGYHLDGEAYRQLLRAAALQHGAERIEGEPGEVLLRGPGLFDAYLDPWLPRRDVVDAAGWFATGDLGRRDAAGRIRLCGRKKTLINVGGMKVFPEEVERVLDAHPKVQRALVEARLHPLYGEVPVARFIPAADGAPTALELRSHCRQHLAGYKIPLLFSAVTELPLTASGKLKRA